MAKGSYQPVCTGGDRRTKRCCCYPTKMKLLICGIIFAVCCIGTGVGWSLFPYPLHASCKIDWTTQLSCDATYQKIYSQIFAWNHTDCGDGENVHQRCRYKLIQNDSSSIKATHTTPLKKYVDDLTFKFKTEGS